MKRRLLLLVPLLLCLCACARRIEGRPEALAGALPTPVPLSQGPYGVPEFITDEHIPYIQADASGNIDPDGLVLRGEACRMLYSLLANPVEGRCSFSDLDPSDACYEAVAGLAAWGVISDSSGEFKPYGLLSRAQLVTMLEAFYPISGQGRAPYVGSFLHRLGLVEGAGFMDDIPSFSDISGHWAEAAVENAVARGWIDPGGEFGPDVAVTRAQFCQIVNAALGRRGDEAALILCSRLAPKQYPFFPDLPSTHPAFGAMMEASFRHNYSSGKTGELWQLPVAEPGFQAMLGQLYYINDDGTLLRDADLGLLHFGPDGRYTTGDAETDEAVEAFLLSCTTEDMSREEKLRAAYLTIKWDYYYAPPSDLPHVTYGSRNFENDWGKAFFRRGSSNCIGYASALCLAARALGYQAQAVFGDFNYYRSPHCWVVITEDDGTQYLYDPEQELARREWTGNFELYHFRNGDPLIYYYEEFYPEFVPAS